MDAKSRKAIFGMAAKLGLDKDGELHTLVLGLTGEEHISKLDEKQCAQLIHELKERLKPSQMDPPPSTRKADPQKRSSAPGMITTGQQGMVWRLMYELRSYDREPNKTSLGDRLVGIIQRQIKVDASPSSPMRWLTFDQGNLLIEILKKYVYNAAVRKSGR